MKIKILNSEVVNNYVAISLEFGKVKPAHTQHNYDDKND